jgi:hypothetical protein
VRGLARCVFGDRLADGSGEGIGGEFVFWVVNRRSEDWGKEEVRGY